jgi:putative hemolysin
VRVVANELLYAIEPLRPLLFPVNNMGGRSSRENLKAIEKHLHDGGALIIFPAGEVSRFSPRGIRDGRWKNGFIKFAEKTGAPIVPVHINARNSLFFYAMSLMARPLSTLMLVDEMFKQASGQCHLTIGHAVSAEALKELPLHAGGKSRLLRKHVYKLGKHGRGELCFLPQMQTVAHPEDRQLLRKEIRGCESLGKTRDGMEMVCYRYNGDSSVMRELGRLRELSFRAVGEGTGKRRDIDLYDAYYQHILLWDDAALELVGAYRLMPVNELGEDQSLYSETLFEYSEQAKALLSNSVELGRSFVQPSYWGKQGLDYLWQGVGAWLAANPEVRYAFGPVSLSNALPSEAKSHIVNFYQAHFSGDLNLIKAKTPYQSSAEIKYPGECLKTEFVCLKASLTRMGESVPTLYKQYTELCEPGGTSFLAFNVDPDFADCIDGLVICDITKMKESKRKRYLGEV